MWFFLEMIQGRVPSASQDAAAGRGDLLLVTIPLLAAAVFFLGLLPAIAHDPSIFTRRYARPHRISGAAFLSILVVGFIDCAYPTLNRPGYDFVLSSMGIVLTLTAAFGFKGGHKGEKVRNRASGALEKDATVTYEEMLEHAFYQGLNLAQIVYIHLVGSASPSVRSLLALSVSLPWMARSKFPVHSFSRNYRGGPLTAENVMYRVKKYQYLLYKHSLLHGLNASLAVSGHDIGNTKPFRLYWVSLNTAYVMEFFLQSLVKRGSLRQCDMLALNRILMLVSTAAALQVLYHHVSPSLSLLSLALNFANRHHEVQNAALVLAAAHAQRHFLRSDF